MNNRINTPDVPQKLVPETFSLARSLDKAGDVDKFNSRRLYFLGIDDCGQLVHSGVGYLDNTDIRFNCAEWIICRFGTGRGQSIKDGRFADIRQSDNSAVKSHNFYPSRKFLLLKRLIALGSPSLSITSSISIPPSRTRESTSICSGGILPRT